MCPPSHRSRLRASQREAAARLTGIGLALLVGILLGVLFG